MPNSLEGRLKGREQEVLEAIRQHGVKETMTQYIDHFTRPIWEREEEENE